MSFCNYCEIGEYRTVCMCNISHTMCPFMRRCSTERKWKPLSGMTKCKLRKEEISLGVNEYKVRFEKNGNLFIEMGERVIQKKNPYDHVPKTVEMVRVGNELYFKGFEPELKEETKRPERFEIEPVVEDENGVEVISKKKKSKKGE